MGLWELCKNWGRLATLAVVPFTKQATPLGVGDVSLVIFATKTILRIAVGLWELCKNWGRLATLAVVPFTKQATPLGVGDVSLVIFATLSHCSPKTESLASNPTQKAGA